MSTKAQTLLVQASTARTPEDRFAAMVTLEAIEPGGSLADPELILLVAEHLDGGKLAVALTATGDCLRKEE